MSSPNRKLIIDAIVALVEGIKKGVIPVGSVNAYGSTVKSVALVKDTPPEILSTDLPQVQIWKGLESVETRSGRQLFFKWPLNFMVVLTEVNEEATDDAIDEIRDDLIACMYQNINLPEGGVQQAYAVELVECYEGVHEDVKIGQLRMLFNISWHRNVLKSA